MTDDDETVEIPIEDALDLHPFRPRDVASVVESYLEEAAAKGFSEVRLIHGRGAGVQKRSLGGSLVDLRPHGNNFQAGIHKHGKAERARGSEDQPRHYG